MRVKHVFEDQIYVISSFGVARNPLYKDNKDVELFKEYMESYLSEICHIYAYSHQENCFHYLIRIKERSKLETFFFRKQRDKKKNISHNIYDIKAKLPPESYLIVSQEVSNCLNAYAKRFNHKYNRKGGLFGDRYRKHLVETAEEMEEWLERLNNLDVRIEFSEDWKVKEGIILENEGGRLSSGMLYEVLWDRALQSVFRNFVYCRIEDLRGYFKNLTQKLKLAAYRKNNTQDPPDNFSIPPPK